MLTGLVLLCHELASPTVNMRLFVLCSTHCQMRDIAVINENFGILVAYMTWVEQRAIETVGSIDILLRNVYL